ncbi:MAG TPA: ABC transporter permease [Blastocatellia bacterium]|nr:ABC transporter permease [Blastocatellia bacterium]
MQTLLRDLRYGMRMLRKNPGFTFIAVFTLALGIGANTAIFSVVNVVLLRPLPYPEPARLIRIWESNPQRGWPYFPASAPDFEDWRKQQSVFEQLAAQENTTFNLTGDGEPERIPAVSVTAELFPALGISPFIGRSFLPEEEQVGRNHVTVLSYDLWRRHFGSDRVLVGQTIQLSGESYTVIGVMPSTFQFTRGTELWVPLILDPAVYPWRADRANRNFAVIGRLKPGVSLAEAQGAMDAIAHNLEQQYPASNAAWGIRLQSFYEWIIPEELRKGLWVLLGAVGFVLLITCCNVANLFLARATRRQREVAIRTALGASRSRVVRQLLTESCMLAFLGGIAGLLLALWGMDLLVSRLPVNIPRLNEVEIERRVLGFTLVISLLTSVIFGLVPALHLSRVNLSEAFKEAARSLSGGAGHRARRLLVISQIALALVLLIGAGLMAQSFVRLSHVRLGFEPDRVLTLQIALPISQYREKTQQAAFYAQALERIRALPGVLGSGAVVGVPLIRGMNWSFPVTVEGRTMSPEEALPADARAVTPQYFATMGIPILQGRDFTERDGSESTNIIISDAMARRLWPNEDALEKRIRPGTNNPWMTIVGVVGDVRNSLDQEPRPTIYFSAAQLGSNAMTVVLRTVGNPEGMSAAVRNEIKTLDSKLPIYNIRTMSAIYDDATGQPRFQAALLGLFAVVALVLAAVGIYGVMSYLVTEREREIGIRMALGAEAGDVLKLVVGQGMKLAIVGVLIGLGGALALTRLMQTLLFGVNPTDPPTFIAITLLLTVVALLACWLPARRAAKVDPMIALRYE